MDSSVGVELRELGGGARWQTSGFDNASFLQDEEQRCHQQGAPAYSSPQVQGAAPLAAVQRVEAQKHLHQQQLPSYSSCAAVCFHHLLFPPAAGSRPSAAV